MAQSTRNGETSPERSLNYMPSEMTLGGESFNRTLNHRPSEMTLGGEPLNRALNNSDSSNATLNDKPSDMTLNNKPSNAALGRSHSPERTLAGRPSDMTLGNDQERPDLEALENEKDEKQIDDAAPDGGYGWVCVACVFLINMHSWGLNSSFGVFLALFMKDDLYPKAGILDYSFIAGLSVAVALILAPLPTFFVRAIGVNFTLLIGWAFLTLSLISSSFTTEIWQLFLSQGVCFGCGLGFLYTASVGLVPQWFAKKRSFASAIATGGSGFGGLVYNLASEAVIAKYGYRWGYRVIGIAASVVVFVCAILVKDRSKAIGASAKVFDIKMFKRMEFNFMQLWGYFSLLGYFVLVYSLPSYAEHVGLSASQGSILGALLNLGQGIGRPLIGLFSDKVGRLNIASILTAVTGVLCLVWWIPATSYGALIAFALVCGLVAGAYWAAIAPVGAEVVGMRDLGCAMSMTWVVLSPPVVFSDAISNEIETKYAYLYAQIYTGLCFIVGGFCLWVVRAWKLGQLEEIAAEERGDTNFKKSPFIKRALVWKKV